MITWEDYRNRYYYDIYAQRYSSDGTALAGNFKVNDDEGSAWWASPSISADGNGNFVITWKDERNGNYHYDIYAQRYLNNGTTLGSNFRVTNTGEKMQFSPAVKLWNNRIYNTWTDNRAGGTGFDIWANVLDWSDPVGIKESGNELPAIFSLHQNYPNPFNPSTTIKYEIPSQNAVGTSHDLSVRLIIYDILGREIVTLVNEQQKPGYYEVQFTSNNGQLTSGVYFYKIQAGSYVEVKRMILLH
ncbi:hypothetical protein BMS3Abin04_03133 [bacterium BMS3Abin04]|nr:hypothetical protein BMS3Abin04_03133 [bacterium BMS3Abin04]